MACQCRERRIALALAGSAVRRGDAVDAAENVRYIARTLIEDADHARRAILAMSRATLGRGIRR